MTSKIDSIYNFKPGKLTKAEQESKIPAMDNFWTQIKNDTTANLPLLRTELTTKNHNPFFYFDCAGLLLNLSQSVSDKKIAIQAIANCDISDIDRRIYVSTINRLANDGINVTSAAVKILSDPKFSFFVPEHAMSFNQTDCLTYMLVPEDPGLYTDTLISIFKNIDHESQKSILQTFWFAYTCKGDSLLEAVATDMSLAKDVRKFAREMQKNIALNKDTDLHMKSIGKDEAGSLRKKSLMRFSDEAIGELLMATVVWRKASNCR